MRLADVQLRDHGSSVVARVIGEVDLSNAEEIGSARTEGVSNDAQELVLDLSTLGYLDSAAAAPPQVVRAQVVRVQAPKSGFDWGDAGIGAAGAVGLAALTGAGVLAITRTRRTTTPPGAIS